MYVFGIVRNSEIFWFPVRELVSVEERVSAEDTPFRYASLRYRGEDKHPQMLLVLGWWSLILFELSFLKPKIWCHRVSLWLAVPHSGVFLWLTIIILNLLYQWIDVFQQTFNGSVGRSMADRKKKNTYHLKDEEEDDTVFSYCFLSIFTQVSSSELLHMKEGFSFSPTRWTKPLSTLRIKGTSFQIKILWKSSAMNM